MSYGSASAGDQGFEKRVARIRRRHSKLGRGYLMSVNHDGLVIARRRRRGLRFPVAGVTMAAAAVIGFKAFAFAYLGAGTYNDRIALLAEGTVTERIAAYAMQADPLTTAIADYLAPAFR